VIAIAQLLFLQDMLIEIHKDKTYTVIASELEGSRRDYNTMEKQRSGRYIV
jgi:hypothetical protein